MKTANGELVLFLLILTLVVFMAFTVIFSNDQLLVDLGYLITLTPVI